MKNIFQLRMGLGLASAALLSILTACQSESKPAATTPAASAVIKTSFTEQELAESKAAFLAAYPVFMHPRCMNCHPNGDAPLQGDDSHIHLQNVQRGPDGKGLYALKCANCHQLANTPGPNMPPGHPDWHLTPPTMRMVFQGRTPHELAAQIKDPAQNGGKDLAQLLHHLTEDSLVIQAGWNPGEGRTSPPLTQQEFAAKMREWIEKGAAVPE